MFGASAFVIGQGTGQAPSTQSLKKSPEPSVPDSQTARDWIRTKAIPLQTVEAGHGFTDLLPLKSIIGDKRVVALGEATHGTREFFQLKHRMVEFLATQKGVTIFSMEADIPEAYRLNDFVLTGKGDAKELIKGMYFWNTQEVLDMVLWMREFNQSGKGHIEFTGFDVQMQIPAACLQIVRNFVQAHDKDYSATLEPIYRDVAQMSKIPMVQGAKSVEKHLEENRASFLQAGVTAKNLDWVIQNAHLVVQYSQLIAGGKTRDESMAENVKWIADHNPGAKLVLWAHNGHVQYQAQGWHPMGEYLRKLFPGELFNFGFAFNQGSFRAVEPGKGLHEFTVATAPEGSLDQTLAATGIALLALDLHQLPNEGPVAKWFDQPHVSRSIGAIYSEASAASYFLNARPQDEFDAILFVNKTTAARGN
jgi:erythromycin esterase